MNAPTRCKVGDLAIVISANIPENIGNIVEIVGPPTGRPLKASWECATWHVRTISGRRTLVYWLGNGLDRDSQATRRGARAGLQASALPGDPGCLRAGTRRRARHRRWHVHSHGDARPGEGRVRWARPSISAWPRRTTRYSPADASCSPVQSRGDHLRSIQHQRRRGRLPPTSQDAPRDARRPPGRGKSRTPAASGAPGPYAQW